MSFFQELRFWYATYRAFRGRWSALRSAIFMTRLR